MIWEYQLNGSKEWIEADAYTLLFKLLPTGKVAAYRVKADFAEVRIKGLLK